MWLFVDLWCICKYSSNYIGKCVERKLIKLCVQVISPTVSVQNQTVDKGWTPSSRLSSIKSVCSVKSNHKGSIGCWQVPLCANSFYSPTCTHVGNSARQQQRPHAELTLPCCYSIWVNALGWLSNLMTGLGRQVYLNRYRLCSAPWWLRWRSSFTRFHFEKEQMNHWQTKQAFWQLSHFKIFLSSFLSLMSQHS